MRIIFILGFLLAHTTIANGNEGSEFHGTWGSPKQCSGDLVKPGGSVKAAPFEIGSQWLKHRDLWCQLSWFPTINRENGYSSKARAHCGEDSIRDYFLGFNLIDGALTINWDFQFSNGPLNRCTGP